jgi:aminoglycoside phosphotransferase (APT) family kinase protein
VVHADYRTGNFLCDTDGVIHAILDWEMAHLGDPLEDLAWGLNPIWCWARDGRVGGLATRGDAIRIWEQASDLRAEPGALHWWEVFSCVKGQAIWVSSAKEFTSGKNQDPILALSGWLMGNSQDRAALHALGHLS